MRLSIITASTFLASAVLLPTSANAQAAGKWRVTGEISGKAFTVDCQFGEQGGRLAGTCIDVSSEEGKTKPGKSHVLTKGMVQGQTVSWTYATKVMIMSVDINFAGNLDGSHMRGTVSAKGREGTFSATRL
jgi:hypothetical protein